MMIQMGFQSLHNFKHDYILLAWLNPWASFRTHPSLWDQFSVFDKDVPYTRHATIRCDGKDRWRHNWFKIKVASQLTNRYLGHRIIFSWPIYP